MARVTLYSIAIGVEQSEVIFGVAVTLRRFSRSHAIFLRSSGLHCRVLLQSGAKVHCLQSEISSFRSGAHADVV